MFARACQRVWRGRGPGRGAAEAREVEKGRSPGGKPTPQAGPSGARSLGRKMEGLRGGVGDGARRAVRTRPPAQAPPRVSS